MRAIDDFEILLERYESSKFWHHGKGRLPDIEATPEVKVDFWNLPKNLFRNVLPLFHRGAKIPHIQPSGTMIWPQFELANGYLFFTDISGWDPWFSWISAEFTEVSMYYVAKDFMSADGCCLVTEWTVSSDPADPPHPGFRDTGIPVSFIGIEGEGCLILHVMKMGWLRLTVVEPPRRKGFSMRRFRHSVFPKMPRHFHLSNATEEDGLRCSEHYTPIRAGKAAIPASDSSS